MKRQLLCNSLARDFAFAARSVKICKLGQGNLPCQNDGLGVDNGKGRRIGQDMEQTTWQPEDTGG